MSGNEGNILPEDGIPQRKGLPDENTILPGQGILPEDGIPPERTAAGVRNHPSGSRHSAR